MFLMHVFCKSLNLRSMKWNKDTTTKYFTEEGNLRDDYEMACGRWEKLSD